MTHEDIIMILVWLVYVGWVGAIIFGVGMIKDAKTIKKFYEYAKKLEADIARLTGKPNA